MELIHPIYERMKLRSILQYMMIRPHTPIYDDTNVVTSKVLMGLHEYCSK